MNKRFAWMCSNEATDNSVFKYSREYRRGPFAADVGAIVHSAAFRRLSNKTQVHLNPRVDYPRTRLTHSLEVAQIGEQLAQIMCNFLEETDLHEYEKHVGRSFNLDYSDLVKASCLAHDLGQPPFGHAGEAALHLLLESKTGKHSCFEANKQNIRLISNDKISVSCAFIDSLVKYKDSVKPSKTGGAFITEKDFLKSVTDRTGTNTMRHPASYLMEAADDIAYITSDIEDALQLEILHLEDLQNHLRNIPLLGTDYMPLQGKEWNEIINNNPKPREIVKYIIRAFIVHVADGLKMSIEGTSIDDVPLAFHNFGNSQNAIVGKDFNILYWKNPNDVGEIARELKIRIYDQGLLVDPSIRKAEAVAKRIVNDLWDDLIPAVLPANYSKQTAYLILPKTYQRRINALHESGKLDLITGCHVIADFVSGMTDRYAIDLWEQLRLPSRLSSAA